MRWRSSPDRVVDGGEVGHRRQRGAVGDALDDVDGAVAGGAAGAVGDRDEGRLQRLQFPDHPPELSLRLGVFGGQNSNEKDPLARREELLRGGDGRESGEETQSHAGQGY